MYSSRYTRECARSSREPERAFQSLLMSLLHVVLTKQCLYYTECARSSREPERAFWKVSYIYYYTYKFTIQSRYSKARLGMCALTDILKRQWPMYASINGCMPLYMDERAHSARRLDRYSETSVYLPYEIHVSVFTICIYHRMCAWTDILKRQWPMYASINGCMPL
jgi:hypothetical protein